MTLQKCIWSFGVLAVTLIFAPAQANAALRIRLTETGGPAATEIATNSTPFAQSINFPTLVFGDFFFTSFGASSNSPGFAAVALATSATVTVTNTGLTSHKLMIEISSNGFTQPVGTTTITSNIGTTKFSQGSGSAAGNTVTFQSYFNNDNGDYSTTGTTTGLQTPSLLGGSSNDSQTGTTTLTSPYSLVQVFIIELNSGASFNFSTSSIVNPSVPEPATIVGAFVGLPILGMWLRRQKAKRILVNR